MSDVELKAVQNKVDRKEKHGNGMKIALNKQFWGRKIHFQNVFEQQSPENYGNGYLSTESELSKDLDKFTKTKWIKVYCGDLKNLL